MSGQIDSVQGSSSDAFSVINDGITAFVIVNGIKFRHTDSTVNLLDSIRFIGGVSTDISLGDGRYDFNFNAGTGGDFSQNAFITRWNSDSTVAHIEASIHQVMATDREDWVGSHSFTHSTHNADLSVTRNDPNDTTAAGSFTPVNALGTVLYGNRGIGDPQTSATIGSGEQRIIQYTGTYGRLELNFEGEWFYTLDATDPDLLALGADEVATDSFTFTSEDLRVEHTNRYTEHSVTITINPESVNQAPVLALQNGWPTQFETSEDGFKSNVPFALRLSDDTTPVANLRIEGVARTLTTEPSGAATSGFATGLAFSSGADSYADWRIDYDASGSPILWLDRKGADSHRLAQGEVVYEQLTLRAVDDRAGVSETITTMVKIIGANDAPRAGVTSIEDSIAVTPRIPYRFTASDFIFEDVDETDTLQSIVITQLPAVGSLTMGGVAVAVGDRIMMDAIDTLAFTPQVSDDRVSVQYRVSDGMADSINIGHVIFTVGAPTVYTRPSKPVTNTNLNTNLEQQPDTSPNTVPTTPTRPVIIDEGKAIVLTGDNLSGSGSNADPNSLFYTLETFKDTRLERYDAESGSWQALGGRFTQHDVNNGLIRMLPTGAGDTASIRVSLADNGGTPVGEAQSLNFSVRLKADIISATIGGGRFQTPQNALDSDSTSHISVETGIGDNSITTGAGNDVIDAGAGDDVVDLSRGGDDVAVYRFQPNQSGGFVAWDGGDRITGFDIGSDTLTFSSTGANRANADEISEFVMGLGSAFEVQFDYALITAGQGGSQLADYTVTGIEIHFPQAVLLPGGKLAGSVLKIEFQNAIAWDSFSDTYLENDADGTAYAETAFDTASLRLGANTAGRDALARILGASVEADTSRGVIIGTSGNDEGRNSIFSNPDSDSVILGGHGTDNIGLLGGAEEVVYRVRDTGTAVSGIDGQDTLQNFTLDTDSLRFVDTDGTAPSLEDLLARPSVVAGLVIDGNTNDYTGINFVFNDSNYVAVHFAAPLDEAALTDRLGLDAGESLSSVVDSSNRFMVGHFDHIEDLFGDNIDVTNSLPTELL